jgi:murein DD-endopeptidase MepM/ murein hydrolase activator NlpD
MRFPVADVNTIHINEAFSTDASAPWGFAHNGIDFMTEQAHEKIYATTNGTVITVALNHFPPKNNWQVNIAIAVNDRYTLAYAIEPMTAEPTVGDAQMKLITVNVGQLVHTGDVLGELIGGVAGAHIHWGVTDNTTSQAICPAIFFTADQQKFLLARIPTGASKLCYP